MKILVVDDTQTNRSLISWTLQDVGHQVLEAENGEQAVAIFARERPDIILMDIIMPIMDGYDATKAIKELMKTDKHTPIIFLTSLSDETALLKCLSIGGDDFISKPIREKVLLAKVEAHTRILELNSQINAKNKQLKTFQKQTIREHNIAKDVFNRAMAASMQDCDNTRHYTSPASSFNGDLLLSAPSVSGGLYTLLADFTGHGLPAAIGALPISQIFYESTRQGKAVGEIARTINKALEKFLPDDMFAVAAIIELNNHGDQLEIWSGGLPDILVTDSKGELKHQIQSHHMPLGVLEDNEFEQDILNLNMAKGDRVYMYSDGITEAINQEGEMFGEERLLAHFNGELEDPLVKLIYDVKQFTGKAQNDDITILEVVCKPVKLNRPNTSMAYQHKTHFPWELTVSMNAEDLRQASPVDPLIRMISIFPSIHSHKAILHTIFSELYANALEHGILGLSSSLKDTVDGYEAYYQQRQERLESLQQGQITIHLHLDKGDHQLLRLYVKDSGKGFDIAKLTEMLDSNASFGRGVTLLEALCETVRYSEKGTRVDVSYRLS